MAKTGKTGADAIYKSLAHICRVITAYAPKLQALIDSLEATDVITTEQAAAASAFIASADAACKVFRVLADNSSIY